MICFMNFFPALCAPAAAAFAAPGPAPQAASLSHCPKSSLNVLPASPYPLFPPCPRENGSHLWRDPYLLAQGKVLPGTWRVPRRPPSSSLCAADLCPLGLAAGCLGGAAGHPCGGVGAVGSISWLAFAGLG